MSVTERQEWTEKLYALLSSPMRLEELIRAMPEIGKTVLKETLDKWIEQGKICKNKKNRYAQAAHFGCFTGTFLATSRGFGFVALDTEDGQTSDKTNDIFIPPDECGDAWHKDRVFVQCVSKENAYGRREGVVLRVLSRAVTELNGTLIKMSRRYYVSPSNTKYPMLALQTSAPDVDEGELVAVSVTDYGSGGKLPQAEIIAPLGKAGTLEASVAGILHENGITEPFSAAALEQAQSIPQTVIGDAERLDLRHTLIFTIDGDDARDFDDAVSLEQLENGRILLGVHIADVSHYVTPESPLDEEAFRRGTSVYYPGHVVPMLPFALSNGICSLNPNVDRFAFSVLLEVDKNGRCHDTRFAKSIICSRARMTYRKVNQILAGDEELRAEYDFLVETLEAMNQLAHTFYQRRIQRGALELEIPETSIIVDESGQPVDIQYRERGESERLIEEFMLQANEAVAEYMCRREYPTVYRVHESPAPDKLRAFAQFARLFGYRIDPGKPEDTFQLQAILRGAKDDPEQRALPTLLLRSLARARYSEHCIGHYGLKAKFYLHFTSPIRRYPDLIAHRMLQKSLLNESFTAADEEMCTQSAQQSTIREMAADTAERDIDKLFIAAYMKQFIGEEFDAMVSGVQPYGLFVALENGCEGLLRVELLGNDLYEYDEEHLVMKGRYTGRRFTIGMPLRVRLIAASEVTGQVDFSMSDAADASTTSKKHSTSKPTTPTHGHNRAARRKKNKNRRRTS